MSIKFEASDSNSGTRATQLRPLLYTAPDEGVAVVIRTARGSALLMSHFGSTITACPVHHCIKGDPLERSRQYLAGQGFVQSILPSQGWRELLDEVMALAGFTPGHVERTLALCAH